MKRRMAGRIPLGTPIALSVAVMTLTLSVAAWGTVANHLVLSEVYYNSPTEPDAETFVELYNPTGSPVSIDGWQLVGINGANGEPYVWIPLSGTVQPHSFFLVGQNEEVGGVEPDIVNPDVNLQNGSLLSGDGVKLENDLGEQVDYAAYGGQSNPLVSLEGTPYYLVDAGQSMERKSGPRHYEPFGNGWDTDSNIDDWRTRYNPGPQSSASPTEDPLIITVPLTEIHCLDVGQGDCTVIISPTGKTFVFDGGPTGQGTDKVVPYLQSIGVDSVDYVAPSHYDCDHIGGLDEVMLALPIREGVYDRGWWTSSTCYTGYLAAGGSDADSIYDGQVFDLGGGLELLCLGLNGNGILSLPEYTEDYSSENNFSVAFKATFGFFDFWVAGDLTGATYLDYVDIESSTSAECGEVEVYRVDHHGSSSNTNENLVAALTPEISIFSVGPNSYGHPTQAVINRLVYAGSFLYLTQEGDGGTVPDVFGRVIGDVVVITDGVGFYAVDSDVYGTLPSTSTPDASVSADSYPSLAISVQPNPFSEGTTISWQAPAIVGDPVHLGIYDVRGRLIDELTHSLGETKQGRVTWDGMSGDRLVPAGIYFVRLRAGEESVTKKVVVAR